MGRPKKREEEARSARLHMRVRPEYLEWVRGLAETAGDDDVAALVERVMAREAKRLKYGAPPER